MPTYICVCVCITSIVFMLIKQNANATSLAAFQTKEASRKEILQYTHTHYAHSYRPANKAVFAFYNCFFRPGITKSSSSSSSHRFWFPLLCFGLAWFGYLLSLTFIYLPWRVVTAAAKVVVVVAAANTFLATAAVSHFGQMRIKPQSQMQSSQANCA